MRRTGRWRDQSGGGSRQPGYAYVGLLIAVGLISLIAAQSLKTGSTLALRAAENELLDRGQELVWALESYARASRAGSSPYPPDVQALLRDPRADKAIVRHLRRLPVDPMTGLSDWVEVRSPNGAGIQGFHSRSGGVPVRREFPPRWAEFSEANTYQEMVFRAGLGD